MKKISRIFIFTILIFSLQNAVAATNATHDDFYEDVFITAQNLLENGAQKEAATEFKRYIFLQNYSKGVHQEQALESLSTIYKNLRNYELALDYNLQAQNYLIQAEQTAALEKLKFLEIELIQTIERTRIHAQNQNKNQKNPQPQSANKNFYTKLFIYSNSEQSSELLKKKAWTTLIKIQVMEQNWNIAKNQFEQLCAKFPELFCPQEQILFYELLSQIENFKFKNPSTALYLSFLPGLGQLYTQNYADSLNAFILNGGLIAISAVSIANLQLQDFILLEASPLFRFYRGNLINAHQQADDWNNSKINEFQSALIALLEF